MTNVEYAVYNENGIRVSVFFNSMEAAERYLAKHFQLIGNTAARGSDGTFYFVDHR